MSLAALSLSHLPFSNMYLEPIYFNQIPTEPIELYQGPLEIAQKQNSFPGEGSVLFIWFPRPRVEFRFTSKSHISIEVDDLTLKLVDLEVEAQAVASSLVWWMAEQEPSTEITGYFSQAINLGSNQEKVTYFTFHLTNFYDFEFFDESFETEADEQIYECLTGGTVLKAEGWKVTIGSFSNVWDDVEVPSSFEIQESLELLGGYAVTNVGRLERSDRSSFLLEEARDCLRAVSYFLSFAKGIWVSPFLLTGFNYNHEQQWQEWAAQKLGAWRETNSWFSPDSFPTLAEVFPGFVRRWQDSAWREVLELAIHWYVESSNQAGGQEGAIVLQQTAFELLAWVLLVEEKGILSSDGFNKLPAADKLRLLLSQFALSLKIPNRLTHLKQVAKEQNWFDGPQAITEMRNGIVHANPKNRQKVFGAAEAARTEAWLLGLKYLEDILLGIVSIKHASEPQ